MPGLELITGRATAPSTTFTALTMSAGNSATVRSAPLDSDILLLQAWADNQADGTFRIRSPRLHDNVQGLRLDVLAGAVEPLLPMGVPQPLIAQDDLVLELTGSGTGGDIESAALLIYYRDLPGAQARLVSPGEVMPRIANLVTVENTLALGTGGGYTGEEALNAEFDLLKANVDYALLGYLVDAECAAVRWRGIDTANLGVGGPGEPAQRHVTAKWFVHLSEEYGLPLIPVFNAANIGGILVDGVQDENGTDVTLTTLLAELR